MYIIIMQWAFEILTVLAALLGTEQVAAQSICMQIASLAFMVPLGVGIASCSIVGNALGAGKKQFAISMAKLAIRIIVCLEVPVGLCIFFLGGYYVNMFTDDEDGF